MALRVAKKDGPGTKLPPPLILAKTPTVKAGVRVFAVGYPEWDGRRNEPQPMSQIFHDIYNVKRLQPGTITKVTAAQKQFDHDCSTLGGNSGSCVIDLDTAKVVQSARPTGPGLGDARKDLLGQLIHLIR
jgi:hypothetical protein